MKIVPTGPQNIVMMRGDPVDPSPQASRSAAAPSAADTNAESNLEQASEEGVHRVIRLIDELRRRRDKKMLWQRRRAVSQYQALDLHMERLASLGKNLNSNI